MRDSSHVNKVSLLHFLVFLFVDVTPVVGIALSLVEKDVVQLFTILSNALYCSPQWP